ncbi:F-box only protein 6 isoform X3 [Ictalurus punctatus]|uniref:F-box only protein 6 isoform X3 n=1 Tax=Ictalurus punctatus TaxID=7998 RepID=A0A9F7RFW4_ICTPU|nr:F-box only protein 6 isoform X3 [Ictalurus punctatus]
MWFTVDVNSVFFSESRSFDSPKSTYVADIDGTSGFFPRRRDCKPEVLLNSETRDCNTRRPETSQLAEQRRMAHSARMPFCPDLPLTIVEEILLNLPGQQVINVCRLVCNDWKSVVDSTAYWRKRFRREGFKPLSIPSVPRDWQTSYFLCKKRRNLLKNPNANENFTGWTIVQNGGHKWAIENVMEPHPDETVTKCFVTSYGRCIKSQLINLEKEGYSPLFMDEVQPNIVLSDWYAPRWDCGSVYEICVELLNRRKKAVKFFQPEPVTFPQWNDQHWEQVIPIF